MEHSKKVVRRKVAIDERDFAKLGKTLDHAGARNRVPLVENNLSRQVLFLLAFAGGS
jgi:hypothetical protein